jgi:hypothetical protein
VEEDEDDVGGKNEKDKRKRRRMRRIGQKELTDRPKHVIVACMPMCC